MSMKTKIENSELPQSSIPKPQSIKLYWRIHAGLSKWLWNAFPLCAAYHSQLWWA